MAVSAPSPARASRHFVANRDQYRSLLLHHAFERILTLLREFLDGFNLGFGDLERVHPGDAHAVLMDMEHDPRRLGVLPVENGLEYFDDEFHRRVVVVEQDTFVQWRPLGLGLLFGA